jgi:hypothetical protein
MATPGPVTSATEWRTPALVWCLPLFGLITALLFALKDDALSKAFMNTLAVSFLIAGASFLVGGLLGFLFGIPRELRMGDALSEDQIKKGQRYSGNSNLEQVSDWLTKVLIGAGLVQLGAFVANIGDFSNSVGDALGKGATADTAALALILYFFCSGFLVVYLYTRLDFGPRIARSEEQYVPSVPSAPPGLPPPPPVLAPAPSKPPEKVAVGGGETGGDSKVET